MHTATKTKTAPARARVVAKTMPRAAVRATSCLSETPHVLAKDKRPKYSPLGFELFYYDDPNFVLTDEAVNRILYGQP
jgi:hypothetical protein